MDAYGALAECYDRLTNDVDYDAVVDFYFSILNREGLRPKTVVDLACGTGSVTLRLAQRGLSVIGVDLSEDMLCVATSKLTEWENAPSFVCQDLTQLHLPKGVDLAVCALDSLDYIIDPEDCKKAIQQIYKVLNPGGCFIFDVNTPEKLQAMDGQTFLDEDDDVYCVWRGEFDADTNICTYGMDIFQRHGALWERSGEIHQEYAYSQEQLTSFLKDAGFTSVEIFGDRRLDAPAAGEQRIYFKARKGKVKCRTI